MVFFVVWGYSKIMDLQFTGLVIILVIVVVPANLTQRGAGYANEI